MCLDRVAGAVEIGPSHCENDVGEEQSCVEAAARRPVREFDFDCEFFVPHWVATCGSSLVRNLSPRCPWLAETRYAEQYISNLSFQADPDGKTAASTRAVLLSASDAVVVLVDILPRSRRVLAADAVRILGHEHHVGAAIVESTEGVVVQLSGA